MRNQISERVVPLLTLGAVMTTARDARVYDTRRTSSERVARARRDGREVRHEATRLTFSVTVTWRFQFAPSEAFALVEREYRVR